MRFAWAAALLYSGSVFAQNPDVAPFVELHPSWQVRSTKKSLFHWYDPTGRYSLVGLRMVLESGHRIYVAQRFERVDNSGDPDTVDEYYIEQRGHWRLGKQYLPFGRREIVRSTVLAARLDTDLLFEGVPLSISACDGGSGRTRGVFGRVGGPIGLSFALGNHIGIQPTDLAKYRNLEEAPGIGRGYRLALGVDTLVSIGSVNLTAEWASLRRGETADDHDADLSDLRLRFRPPGSDDRVNIGWSRDWAGARDYLSAEFELEAGKKISYLPMIRFEGFSFKDFALTAVVRL